MTDGITKTTRVNIDVSLVDTSARKSFRAFGTSIGTAKTPELGTLSVLAFGDVLEIHASGIKFMVEFSLKGIVGEAHKLMTLARENKLAEYDAHPMTTTTDRLLAALEKWEEYGSNNGGEDNYSFLAETRAAIAAAKGGA